MGSPPSTSFLHDYVAPFQIKLVYCVSVSSNIGKEGWRGSHCWSSKLASVKQPRVASCVLWLILHRKANTLRLCSLSHRPTRERGIACSIAKKFLTCLETFDIKIPYKCQVNMCSILSESKENKTPNYLQSFPVKANQ